MNRDGASISLWQDGINDYENRSVTSSGMLDVLIVGGGITGITTGLLLQRQGKKCLIAEAHNLCFGTTGGTTAHLNTFMDTPYDDVMKDFGEDGAQQLHRAARQSLDLVKENVSQYRIDCGYTEEDGFVYAQDEKQAQALKDLLHASLKAGAEIELADRIPVPIPFQSALVYHRQAQFHPARYVHALASAFEAAGGIILQNCPVQSVKGEDPLEVETSQGILKAKHLIYATHIPPGINLLHFRCAPYRSYAIAATLSDGAYPKGLAYDMYDPYHYFRSQEIDGVQYLIAGGEDHKTAHEQNTEQCFTHLEAYVRKYFKIDKVAFKWSSQYFEPSDGLAYIGHLPGNPDNVYVATGYGGNGMTYSHIAAITLSDLILKGNAEFADLFDPSRIKMVAGFNAFVKENADVVAQFVGKRIGLDKPGYLAELAPGEGKVVKFEGDSIAVYKDDSGKLFAVNPVCTHAKCVVGWNNAEKSWDCPCHGARYSIRGEVLTGPARKGLEVVELSQQMQK